jgi:soluble lytic murein transglycosylase
MPLESTRIPRLFCGPDTAMRTSGRFLRATGPSVLVCSALVCSVCFASAASQSHRKAAPAASASASSRRSVLSAAQLEKLSRLLKGQKSAWAYTRLSALAQQRSSGVLGERAALALGFFDYNRQHYPEAAKWFSRARKDPLLGDYALYWSAENELATNNDAAALADLQQFRQDYPDSVTTEQALEALGTAAIGAKRPTDAVAALDAYPQTPQRSALLFLRGEAHEEANQILEAAADYRAVYEGFPTSEHAREAGVKLDFLRGTPGVQIPPIPVDDRLAHAEALFAAKDWTDARDEYSQALPQLSGAARERAELRVLECGMSLGAGPSEVTSLQITDPDVDAERSYALAQYYWNQQQEAQMIAEVEAAAVRAPTSYWTEAALFAAGNYYWVQLDRAHASSYYKRVVQDFPNSPDAPTAQWRVAWTETLTRQPDAAELLETHLRSYRDSPYAADALYWLGRLAEEAGVQPLARSYYEKLTNRYTQNYFGLLGAARLRELGPGPTQTSDVLSVIAPMPDPPALDDAIPPAAADRKARADALRSIAFDSSAELELRAAYAATHEPRLLFEAAQEAAAAGQYGAAIVTIRQIFPQLESQAFSEIPREVWLTAYSLPFESSIRHWSSRTGLDPLLVAGLIRQESAFEPDARSVSDAFGLMQLLPKTARQVARQQRLRYSRARLTDPDYNVRLGTAYFAGLEKQFGSVEAALAAYNAGEDRVVSWTAGQTYHEPAEFVESIPFTQTRLYVQIITRNAAIYRRLYGAQNANESRTARTGRGE